MAERIRGITVEIGGDVAPLNKALATVNTNAKSIQSELKRVERLLKLDPTNTTLLTQKQELLTKAVAETSTTLEALKQAKEQADDAIANGAEVDQEQYRKLQQEIVAAEEKLKDLQKQAKTAGSTLSAALEEASAKLEKFGRKATDAGKTLAPVSAAAAGIGVAAGKMAMDFEDSMAKVSTIADTTQVSLADLEEQISALSNETGIASTSIAEDVYNAISAGQETKDAVAFVAEATKLAKAGFTDSASALDILTTTLNAYGLEASEVTRISDLLMKTQNLGKVTVGELSSYMGKAITPAKQNNIEMEQLAAAYAVVSSKGLKAADATTDLSAMLNEMGKSGSKVDTILREQTGKSFAELSAEGKSLADVLLIVKNYAEDSGATFADMWSQQSTAFTAADKILGESPEEFNAVLAEMQDSAGTTQEAFEKMQTTSDKLRKAFNEVKNTMLELGQALMETLGPIIEKVVEKIHAFSQWFSNLSSGGQKLVATLLTVTAAISPLLIFIGKVSAGMGAVTGVLAKLVPVLFGTSESVGLLSGALNFLAANPMVLVVAAITSVVAILAHLYKTNEDFRNAVNSAWTTIQETFQKFDGWLQTVFAVDWSEQFGFIGHVVNAFLATAKGAWEGCKQTMQGLMSFIKSVFAGDWKAAWQGIVDVFAGIFQGIELVAKGPLNGLIALLNMVVSAINWVIDGINSISITVPDWVPELGGEKIGFALDRIDPIPYLAKGGILSQGSAIVGEAGAELLSMRGGRATVTPLTNGAAAVTAPTTAKIVLALDGREIGSVVTPIVDRTITAKISRATRGRGISLA